MTRSIRSRPWSDASPSRDRGDFSDLYARHRFGMRLGLDRIRAVVLALGLPQEKFASVHIAGTNGKGSTAAMIEAILRAAGCRTGLYTSPHLVAVTERFRIDGAPVGPEELKGALDRVMVVERGLGLEFPLTFFEVTTAAAFLLFTERGIAWGVIEAGLGGRLDATNVVSPRATVITAIGLDHGEYLGETVAAIAAEKGGIIKPGVPVICGAGSDAACGVIHQMAGGRGSPVTCCRLPTDLPVRLLGRHQRMNAALAVAAVASLRAGGEADVTEDHVRVGLAQVEWPGRLQVLSRDPTIMVDGAHNPHAVRALVNYIKEEDPRPWTVILGMMADKDGDAVLDLLRPVVHRLILVRMANERSWNPPGAVDLTTALRLARADLPPGGGILITGSLYLVGEALGFAA